MKLKFLYTFTYKSNIYRYCSGNKDTTFNNLLYKAQYISHSALIYSVDENLCEASIFTDIDNEVARLYLSFIPTSKVAVSIHVLVDDNIQPRYWGRVKEVLITNDYEVEIKIAPPIDTEKVANRWTYQSTCNHFLYSPNCGVDINNFSFLTTVTNVSEDGTEITVDAIDKTGIIDDQWLVGGRIIIEQTGAASSIMNVDHGSKTLIMLSYFNITVGTEVRLAAGCNRSRSHCINKFNNLSKQLAESWVPGRDPTKGI